MVFLRLLLKTNVKQIKNPSSGLELALFLLSSYESICGRSSVSSSLWVLCYFPSASTLSVELMKNKTKLRSPLVLIWPQMQNKLPFHTWPPPSPVIMQEANRLSGKAGKWATFSHFTSVDHCQSTCTTEIFCGAEQHIEQFESSTHPFS